MIDYTMYRRLYPNKDIFDVPDKGDIVPKDGDEPPDDDFLACLPATIHGFSFSSKSWSKCLLLRPRKEEHISDSFSA